MPKQTNKSKVQTGGKKRKDRVIVRPRLHPHPRPRPRPRRPRPRTTVVCNIM